MSNNPGLAYEDTPPFSAPLRFFISAPLFGCALGLLLLVDPGLLASRWSPGALAAVHLFAAGFMLQVMIGALQQIMPVVAGAALPHALWLARIIHPLTSVGALALGGGLALMHPTFILAGALLLAGGLLCFLAGATLAVLRSPRLDALSHTARDLRLALFGLGLTAALGLVLALSLSEGLALPLSFVDLVDVHASWGLLGWASLLLAASSWVVVPMFQITPAYPARFTRCYAPLLLLLLVLWSLLRVQASAATWTLAGLPLLAGLAGFALLTLQLQTRSRRSKPDASFRAFRIAMLAFCGGLLCLAAGAVRDSSLSTVLAAVLILHGGFGGAISAMLYKIVPFLSWLHLSQAGIRRPPNVKKLLPDQRIRRQLHSHHASLLLLALAAVVATVAPAGSAVASRLAGLCLIVEFGWLLLNIVQTLRNWQQARAAAGLGRVQQDKISV